MGLNSLVVGAAVLITDTVFVLVGLWGKVFLGLAVGCDWRWTVGTDWDVIGPGVGNGSADKSENDKALQMFGQKYFKICQKNAFNIWQ